MGLPLNRLEPPNDLIHDLIHMARYDWLKLSMLQFMTLYGNNMFCSQWLCLVLWLCLLGLCLSVGPWPNNYLQSPNPNNKTYFEVHYTLYFVLHHFPLIWCQCGCYGLFFLEIKSVYIFHSALVMIEPSIYAKKNYC